MPTVSNPLDDMEWSAQNAFENQSGPPTPTLTPYQRTAAQAVPAGQTGKELWNVPGRVDSSGNPMPVSSGANGRPRDYKQDEPINWNAAASDAGYDRRQAAAAAAATASRAPGVGGGSGSVAPAAPDDVDLFSTRIRAFLDDVLAGKNTRYNPETVAALQSQAVRSNRGQARVNRERVLQDAARRGMFRSADTNPALADIDREASTGISTAFQKIATDKATADLEDRLNAVNQGMAWLQSIRNYKLGTARNESDRAIADAQIRLGYAGLANQKEMLNMQLAKMGGGGGGGGNSQQEAILNAILSSIVK